MLLTSKSLDQTQQRPAYTVYFLNNQYMSTVSGLLKGSPPIISPQYLPAPYNIRYGSFGSTDSQTVTGANQATPITHNLTFIANGVDYDPANPSHIRITADGVYKVSYSVQLDKAGGGISTCDIWIAIDGVNVPTSASRDAVAGNNGESFVMCEYIFQLNSGQYFEVIFASPDDTMTAQHFAAVAPYPEVPSIITNVIQIS